MRTKTTRRLALLVAMVPAMLFGMLVVSAPANAALVPFQTLQSDIVYWTNHQRAKAHCPKVRVDTRLVRAGRDHSGWMAFTGRFSHVGRSNSTFVTRVRTAGYYRPLSENIAYGYRSGAEVVNAWMRSPGHRANMLNCRAKAVGVGAVYSRSGTPYYTQNFGTV